jgi:hypothetical protein
VGIGFDLEAQEGFWVYERIRVERMRRRRVGRQARDDCTL